MGLKDNECGQIGVTMIAGTLGWIMDAPAATAYAVLPVGVDTMRPLNETYSADTNQKVQGKSERYKCALNFITQLLIMSVHLSEKNSATLTRQIFMKYCLQYLLTHECTNFPEI